MTQENPESQPQQPGTALVRINARLRELEKMPEIHESSKTLGEKLADPVGLGMFIGGFAMALFAAPLFASSGFGTILIVFGLLTSMAGPFVAMSDMFGLCTKADKKRLALESEYSQLVREKVQQDAQNKRQRCERLKTLARETVESIKDENRAVGFFVDLRDPEEPREPLRLGITEVVTYAREGALMQRVTARLYHPVASGEFLKAPEVEGVGPLHSERPARDIGPLRLPGSVPGTAPGRPEI